MTNNESAGTNQQQRQQDKCTSPPTAPETEQINHATLVLENQGT
jgi:hypothetical protein